MGRKGLQRFLKIIVWEGTRRGANPPSPLFIPFIASPYTIYIPPFSYNIHCLFCLFILFLLYTNIVNTIIVYIRLLVRVLTFTKTTTTHKWLTYHKLYFTKSKIIEKTFILPTREC